MSSSVGRQGQCHLPQLQVMAMMMTSCNNGGQKRLSLHVHGAPSEREPAFTAKSSSAAELVGADDSDDAASNHPLRSSLSSSLRRSRVIRTAVSSTSNDITTLKSMAVSAKASIATGLLLATWSFGTPPTTTNTPSSISQLLPIPVSSVLSSVFVANAVEERNELLCGTGFFTNIYQYKCTEIGDIEKDGKSRDLSSEELSSVSSLMDKLDIGTSGSGSESSDSGGVESSTSNTNEK